MHSLPWRARGLANLDPAVCRLPPAACRLPPAARRPHAALRVPRQEFNEELKGAYETSE